MREDFTKYREAKRFYNLLSHHSNKSVSKAAKECLEMYEDFKETKGEFVAARFILESYKMFIASNPIDRVMVTLYGS